MRSTPVALRRVERADRLFSGEALALTLTVETLDLARSAMSGAARLAS